MLFDFEIWVSPEYVIYYIYCILNNNVIYQAILLMI